MASYMGLWKRETIQIGDAAPYEDAIVYWLQAETYFADIRIPLTQPSPSQSKLLDLESTELLKYAQITSFAGTIEATATWIRWHRTIDFKPDPSSIDQGKVHYQGNNLIEIGEFAVDGETQSYLEIWVPQPCDCNHLLVLELIEEVNTTTQTITHPKALWVAVGEHFIKIYDNRFYPPDFVAPEPTELAASELKRLMQFQTDYGRCDREIPWEIFLSNDPARVGTSLQSKPNYRAELQTEQLVETWQTPEGEIQQYWAIREAKGEQRYFMPSL